MNRIILAALLLMHSAVTAKFSAQQMQLSAPRGVVVSGKVTTTQGGVHPTFVQTVTLNPESSPSVIAPPQANSLGGVSGSLEVPVRKDGTFEFRSVRPGRYALRTLPITARASAVSVEVAHQNLRDVQIVVPYQIEVRGRIMNLPRNLLIHPIIQSDQGTFTMATTALDDGTFMLRLTEGENRVLVSKLPPGLVVKTITFGETDITDSALKIEGTTTPQNMTITIEATTLPAVSAKGTP